MTLIDKIKNYDLNICKFNIAQFLRTMLLLTPIMLLFYQENGLTVKELFMFQGFFYLTSILVEAPIGSLSDHISRKFVLIISYSVFMLITLLWLFFQGYFIILLGEVLMATSKVMMDNAQSGYLYDYLNTEKRTDKMPKLYGYLDFFLSTGTTIAAIIGTWLYIHLGSKAILITELLITVTSISLISSLPNVYSPNRTDEILNIKIKKYFKAANSICNNKAIMNYILYSGFFTSFSIVFALSFQPLMLKATLPVVLFGVAAFCNHGIRALFSALTGKISKLFNLRSMIIPLFFLYLLAFGCIFSMLYIKNRYMIMGLIFIICLIIGCQLLFTIRHVSRIHSMVESKNRGTLISVNNFVSRFLTFLILFSSKICMDKLGFENYYLIIFGIFVVCGLFLTIQTYRVKEFV